MKLLTGHLPCGPEVQIDIDSSTPLLLVKQRIFEASGLPIEHQKVLLSGINQIVVGDKRCAARGPGPRPALGVAGAGRSWLVVAV